MPMNKPSSIEYNYQLQKQNEELRRKLLQAELRIAQLEDATLPASPKKDPQNHEGSETRIQLRQSKNRYRKYFNYATDAMYVFYPTPPDKPVGTYLDVNKEAIRRMGYSLEEFLELSPLDINGDDSEEDFRERLAILQRDGHISFESTHRTKSGQRIPVEITALLLEVDGEELILVGARDITGRKNSEEALRESERLYRLLADNVHDVIWTTDIQLRPKYISPSVTNLIGFEPSQAMSMLYRSIILESPLFEEFPKDPVQDWSCPPALGSRA